MNVFGNVNQLDSLGQQNKVKISVRGWKNATQQDLLNFVTRKTHIKIQNSYVQGDLIIGYVNKQDLEPLLKFNGIRFAGNGLKFEDLDGSGSATTSNTITLLKNFLFKRYNAETKMLDLGDMYKDVDLVQNGLVSNMSTQSKMFLALMKLASTEHRLLVESVNLSNNNLKDLSGITTLAQTFPKLKNLCLANNQIAKFQSLDVWKNKFKELRELIMINNPVANDGSYRTELMRIFPKLVILDNVIIRDEKKLNAVFSLPVQIQQFFFEDNNLGLSAIEFVSNFLGLWDTDRAQLMGLYTTQSQFSVSVDSSMPGTTVAEADQSPSFGYYLLSSRNIIKVSSEKSKQERLGMGPEAIGNCFKALPKTKHFLQEKPDNYSLQTFSYSQVGGFIICLHGVFEETAKPELENLKSQGSGNRYRRYNHGYQNSAQNKLSKKSFDRTWVVVSNQGSIIIASDLLTVRSYTEGAWVKKDDANQTSMTQKVSAQTVAVPNPHPSSMQQITGTSQVPLISQTDGHAEFRVEMLNRLHQATKLNAEYTLMLAEQSGWDYEVAIKGFQSSFNNLPRNAFV